MVALGVKHQTLLRRLGQVEADITAAVSQHESREAVSAEEAQKVGLSHLRVVAVSRATDMYLSPFSCPPQPLARNSEDKAVVLVESLYFAGSAHRASVAEQRKADSHD